MEMITISCVNDGRDYELEQGQPLSVIAPQTVVDLRSGKEFPVLAALVDHELKSLDFPVFYPHRVEFIGLNHTEGRRVYIRSLSFLAQAAVRQLFPDRKFKINHSLPSGYYCKLRGERITDEQILAIRERMREIVARDLPFTSRRILSSEAMEIFQKQNQPLKAGLIESLGQYFTTVYYLDGVVDNFYGPLAPSTGYMKVFDLMPFHHGFCLQYPQEGDEAHTIPRQKQLKLTNTLKDYGYWCKTTGVVSVGALNKMLLEGKAVELINLCEARQEIGRASCRERV